MIITGFMLWNPIATAPQPNSIPEGVARRTRLFIPAVIVISMVLLVTLFIFVTFEDTAISTVEIPPQVEKPYQPLQISEASGRIHSTIQRYNGPESCTGSGCHNARPLENAAASRHGQHLTLVEANPYLVKLSTDGVVADDAPIDCLACHAGTGESVTVDASPSAARLDAVTGFYFPQASREETLPVFAWRSSTSQPAAVIVPQRTMTILAPKEFNPAAFAKTGNGGSGANQQTTIHTSIAHSATRRRCLL